MKFPWKKKVQKEQETTPKRAKGLQTLRKGNLCQFKSLFYTSDWRFAFPWPIGQLRLPLWTCSYLTIC